MSSSCPPPPPADGREVQPRRRGRHRGRGRDIDAHSEHTRLVVVVVASSAPSQHRRSPSLGMRSLAGRRRPRLDRPSTAAVSRARRSRATEADATRPPLHVPAFPSRPGMTIARARRVDARSAFTVRPCEVSPGPGPPGRLRARSEMLAETLLVFLLAAPSRACLSTARHPLPFLRNPSLPTTSLTSLPTTLSSLARPPTRTSPPFPRPTNPLAVLALADPSPLPPALPSTGTRRRPSCRTTSSGSPA